MLRLACLAGLVVLVAACSPGRTVEAVGLLRDVARQEMPADIARRAVTYGEEGRRAWLYERPGARAGLILVPGAAEAALDDPRLVAFADALSRRGFVVMVPALAGEDPLQISARDAEAVAEAIAHMRAVEGLPEVGLAAPSYAAGPTILAALRPETAPGVRFILTIGAYHDMVESITFVTTGAYRAGPGEPWRRGEVEPAAKWIFLASNAERVSDAGDRRRLGEIARGRLAGLDTRRAEAALGPEGRRVLSLFVNADPERVPALIADLPDGVRDEIEALDLARVPLEGLGADLILVHGRGDRLVPYTESVRMAERLGRGRARLYLLRDLQHVDLEAPGLADAAALVQVAYRVLAERDRAPAPARPARVGGSS